MAARNVESGEGENGAAATRKLKSLSALGHTGSKPSWAALEAAAEGGRAQFCQAGSKRTVGVASCEPAQGSGGGFASGVVAV